MNIIKGALQTVDVETAIIRGGYIPVNSFEKGFTLASPEQALQLEKTNEYFVWSGSFPKTVPKESTPDTIGGFGPNAWIDVSNLTFRTHATAPDGYTLIPSLQPRPACGRTIYADRNAGVFPTNSSQQNGMIINSLLIDYDEIIFVEPVPLGEVIVSAKKRIRALHRAMFDMDETVSFGLKVERGCVGSIFENITFRFNAPDQIAWIYDGKSGDTSKSYPQYNNSYNCDTEGAHVDGSISMLLSYTWSNRFFGCNFNRTMTGIVFGRDTDPDGYVNYNVLFGCEIRSDKTKQNSGSPIIHRSGGGNALIGCAIENWLGAPIISGGNFLISGGYLEAMDTATKVGGGRLIITDCHDNGPAIVMDADGSSLVYENNLFTGSAYTSGYPKIQRRGDIDASITISGVESGRAGSVLIRPGQYRGDTAIWYNTSPRKSRESIDHGFSSISARIGDDQLNVTGTDNFYTVRFNNSTIDADSGNEFNATVGIFTAGIGGVRTISGGVYLGGVTSGQPCELFVVTTDRKYLLATRRGDGISNIFLSGTVSIPVFNGQTVRLQVIAHGSATKTVSVLRGNAVDGYSYLSIVK
ncbi:hypothetical protein [Serratia fonticola]|uniref:tail fiber/spike domain-containing protein n=1 Tax=Serratia fonticola TaxID=47917 RepID=UPI00301C894A